MFLYPATANSVVVFSSTLKVEDSNSLVSVVDFNESLFFTLDTPFFILIVSDFVVTCVVDLTFKSKLSVTNTATELVISLELVVNTFFQVSNF